MANPFGWIGKTLRALTGRGEVARSTATTEASPRRSLAEAFESPGTSASPAPAPSVAEAPPEHGGRARERRGGGRESLEGLRVLVVDDSTTVLAILKKMLTQNGCEVQEALDAETGLELAFADPPDLILLDIVLPGMSGFVALRLLRKNPQTRDLPVIMISGNKQATEEYYVQRIGADDFMTKPFTRAELFERVQRVFAARRAAADAGR
jgi:twitching motility two-component system response regulator PilH